MIFGSQGRGKTYAMACVYQRWPIGHPGSKQPKWFNTGMLLRKIMTCRTEGRVIDENHHDVFEDQLFNRFANAPLVCCDDIGTRLPSDAHYEALLSLVNSRCGFPTIYTSNSPPMELAKIYDGRMASRLCAGTVLELIGDDSRLKNSERFQCK
jgi:DNA replication protein DnaC